MRSHKNNVFYSRLSTEPARSVGSEYIEVMAQADCGVLMGIGGEQLLLDKHIIYQKYPKVAYNIILLFTVMARYTSKQWHIFSSGRISSVPDSPSFVPILGFLI